MISAAYESSIGNTWTLSLIRAADTPFWHVRLFRPGFVSKCLGGCRCVQVRASSSDCCRHDAGRSVRRASRWAVRLAGWVPVRMLSTIDGERQARGRSGSLPTPRRPARRSFRKETSSQRALQSPPRHRRRGAGRCQQHLLRHHRRSRDLSGIRPRSALAKCVPIPSMIRCDGKYFHLGEASI